MANAQVILKEKIEGLGAEADVVKVRAGYARNFLIPQGKAFEASKSNLRHVESLKVARARREAEELVGFQEIATKISKLKPKFELSTGQGGKAFGSVTSIDARNAELAIDGKRLVVSLGDSLKEARELAASTGP